jgi:hypothetical protein
MRALILGALLLSTAAAAQPILKHGTCPDRYHGDGSYCVPYPNAGPVINKGSGSCPSGYHASGDGYCVGYGDAKPAVERPPGATCSSGFGASGGGCTAF